jgi:hypothetical protein
MGHVKKWNTRFELNEASVLHMPLPHLLAVCAVHERNLQQVVRLEFEAVMAVSLRRRLMAGSRAQFETGRPLRIRSCDGGCSAPTTHGGFTSAI